MNQYIITYIGGDKPSSPEEGKQHFAQYQQWLASLGEAVVKPMVPFKDAHTVSADRTVAKGSAVAMTGHTVIQAASIDQAIDLAKSCPFLDINGCLEVAQIVSM